MQPAPPTTTRRRPAPATLALMAAVAVVVVAAAAVLGPEGGGAGGATDPHAGHAPAAGPDTETDTDAATAASVDDGSGHHHATGPEGPVISLDDPRVTPGQRAAAQDLIDRTRAAMAAFPDEQSVRAAGYVSIGDGITGYEHFIHLGHITNGDILDPERVESIVMEVRPDGTKAVVSAMYILPPGYTMDDVPDVAGPLTVWHDHQDLCWEGIRVVGRTGPDGSCARGEFRGTAPMLHVWLVDHPCGPFAGLEGHGGACGPHEH